MSGNRNNRKSGGFSLLELTCALFIITFGIFGALQMYVVAMDKIKVMNEDAVAQRLLRNELETLRAQPYAALNVGLDQPFISRAAPSQTLSDAVGQVNIQTAASNPDYLKEVCVRLKWRSEHGRWVERSLTTLIADKGVGL